MPRHWVASVWETYEVNMNGSPSVAMPILRDQHVESFFVLIRHARSTWVGRQVWQRHGNQLLILRDQHVELSCVLMRHTRSTWVGRQVWQCHGNGLLIVRDQDVKSSCVLMSPYSMMRIVE